jgi:hypothetical protein
MASQHSDLCRIYAPLAAPMTIRSQAADFYSLIFPRWAENPDNGIPVPLSSSMAERERSMLQWGDCRGRSHTEVFSETKCGIVYQRGKYLLRC